MKFTIDISELNPAEWHENKSPFLLAVIDCEDGDDHQRMSIRSLPLNDGVTAGKIAEEVRRSVVTSFFENIKAAMHQRYISKTQ